MMLKDTCGRNIYVLTFSSARCGADLNHFCVGSVETGKDDGGMQVFQGMDNWSHTHSGPLRWQGHCGVGVGFSRRLQC